MPKTKLKRCLPVVWQEASTLSKPYVNISQTNLAFTMTLKQMLTLITKLRFWMRTHFMESLSTFRRRTLQKLLQWQEQAFPHF
ncbi:hypothetical protein B566_EDAN007674, partial [Ephemera danica]